MNKDNEAYISNLYHKALLLLVSNKDAEAAKVAAEGFNATTDDYWKTMLNAIVYSALLRDDSKSALHLREIIIPKLQEYGQYEAAGDCYQQLSAYFHDRGNTEIALKYSNYAVEAFKKFNKELKEGDE